MGQLSYLPQQFSDLEEFAQGWAAPTADERHRHRQNSSMDEIHNFYDRMRPRLIEAIEYIDDYDIKALPDDVERLLFLTFGFIEASIAVEIFKVPGVTDVPFPNTCTVTREMYRPTAHS